MTDTRHDDPLDMRGKMDERAPEMEPVGQSVDQVRRFDVLKTEFQALAAYDSTATAVMSSAGTIGLGLIVFAVGRDYATIARTDLWVQALLPLAPISYLAFVVHLSNLVAMRAKHFREVEREIAHVIGAGHTNRRARLQHDKVARDQIPIPSTARASLMVTQGFTSVRGPSWVILAGYVGLYALIVSLVVTMEIAIFRTSLTMGLWTSMAYSALLVLLFVVNIRGNLSTARMWEQGIPVVMGHAAGYDSTSRRWRLLIYLMPRYRELGKLPPTIILVVLMAFATGNARPTAVVLLAMLLFEVVFYQGRYLWNDLLGASEDEAHSQRVGRGRIPFSERPGLVRPAVVSLAVRMIVFAVVCAFPVFIPVFSLLDRLMLASCATTVLFAAFIYERLRMKWRSVEGGSPGRPSTAFRLTISLIAVGYFVRGAYGAYLGGLSAVWILIAAMAMAGYGLMFVICAWVLEGAGTVGESFEVNTKILAMKPHVRWLAYRACILRPRSSEASLAFRLHVERTAQEVRELEAFQPSDSKELKAHSLRVESKLAEASPLGARLLKPPRRLTNRLRDRSWFWSAMGSVTLASVLAVGLNLNAGTFAVVCCLAGGLLLIVSLCFFERGTKVTAVIGSVAPAILGVTAIALCVAGITPVSATSSLMLPVFFSLGYSGMVGMNYREVSGGMAVQTRAAWRHTQPRREALARFFIGDFAYERVIGKYR